MKIKIFPSTLKGVVEIPPSKSYAHRGIIVASLASGESYINNVDFSEDIETTINMMRGIGARIDVEKNSLRILGNGGVITLKNDFFNLSESGSSLRFLIPLLLLQDKSVVLNGSGKLVSRPLDSYYEIFSEQGIEYETNSGELPLKIKGRLKSGKFKIKGDVSSQFISGLLFALPLLNGDSVIEIEGELQSASYVDLTIAILKLGGINIEKDGNSFHIKGNQKYSSITYTVEGDYSQGAFFMVAGALGNELILKNLNDDSLQGDKAILDILKDMNCKVEIDENIEVKKSETKGRYIDISQCPDIGPILTLLLALSSGEGVIGNGARLRIKESDRITSIKSELNKLGCLIEEGRDFLKIKGVESLKGGVEVDSWNDHRIAMTLAIAATRCSEAIILNNYTCVKKSYPNFFSVYQKLGGKIEYLD